MRSSPLPCCTLDGHGIKFSVRCVCAFAEGVCPNPASTSIPSIIIPRIAKL
jgi:hypothetical protein